METKEKPQQQNTEICSISKENFPVLLTHIQHPPKQLRIRGALPAPNTLYICIVGSRSCTPYGKEACGRILSGLIGQNICIVSGLALGLDTYAHEKALDLGLRTIAFPGSGLDDKVLYPSTNRRLAARILEAGGALLSEFNDDFRATQWSFPTRNRLMAGISHLTLIVEAGPASGTLITARHALDYGREVCVVPGSIFSETSCGALSLLKDGAHPVTCGEDILNILGINAPITESEKAPDNLSFTEQKVFNTLMFPTSLHELCRITSLPAYELMAILSELELRGLIRQNLCGEYTLAKSKK